MPQVFCWDLMLWQTCTRHRRQGGAGAQICLWRASGAEVGMEEHIDSRRMSEACSEPTKEGRLTEIFRLHLRISWRMTSQLSGKESARCVLMTRADTRLGGTWNLNRLRALLRNMWHIYNIIFCEKEYAFEIRKNHKISISDSSLFLRGHFRCLSREAHMKNLRNAYW